MNDISISDKGNGIIILIGDKFSLKTDTNRRLYVKDNNLGKSFVFTEVYLPMNLSNEQKKSYLFDMYNMCYDLYAQKPREVVKNE